MKTYTLGEYAEWLLDNKNKLDDRIVRVDDVIKDGKQIIEDTKLDKTLSYEAKLYIEATVQALIDELSQSSPDVTKGDEISSRDNSKQKSCVSSSGRDISNDDEVKKIINGLRCKR